MAPTSMTVIYPVTEEPFNIDYYLNSHIKTVERIWGPLGLLSWRVVKLDPSSGFVYQATILWESGEKFQAAIQNPDSKVILTDSPNYTTGKAITYIGGEIASSE